MIHIEDSEAGPGIASRLGVKPGTVRRWRTAGRGPRTWVQNGRVTSTPEDVAEYLNAVRSSSLRAA
ncbi:hypothetical protein ACEZDG_14395 [Streptacidiphilus sp. N1-1]